MWRVVKPLRPHALSVGQARTFCVRRLTSVLSGDDPDADGYADGIADAATVATELVTNAIAAGSSTISMSLELRSCGVAAPVVRIEVFDDASGQVVARTPLLTESSGRGLMIVSALAREWGVTGEAGAKQVWADVPLAADVA